MTTAIAAHEAHPASPGRLGPALVVVAVVVAAAMRVNNALRYRTRMGFDAIENVEYVQHLLGSWQLPAPDAAWATSHPPFFYYASALLGRGLALFGAAPALAWLVPLASSAAGLATAWLVYRLLREVDPASPRRAWIGALLVLYAPVHVYMSAMFSEEILASTLSSFAAITAATFALRGRLDAGDPAALRAAAGIGLLGGLAWLTKLSGLLVVAAIAIGWGATAWRRGALRPAVGPISVLAAVAALTGGWFYAHNLAAYGYLYPQDLAVHAVIHEMPPGERGLLDYVRLPLATFTDPQLIHPDLLRSVWGSTYATLWFDGHRHFLPSSPGASTAGRVLLVLALVPTAAFFVGAARGCARWWRAPDAVDGVLLALLGLTTLGYVAFTWSNPWFATIKGSYLLGAVAPFAYYASESLDRWLSGEAVRRRVVGTALALLGVGVAITFTIGVVFTKLDATGLPWREMG
jgi:hypothetical protein